MLTRLVLIVSLQASAVQLKHDTGAGYRIEHGDNPLRRKFSPNALRQLDSILKKIRSMNTIGRVLGVEVSIPSFCPIKQVAN